MLKDRGFTNWQIVPEQDRSISLLFLPEASDRNNDVYDEMDKAEAAMEQDTGSALHITF